MSKLPTLFTTVLALLMGTASNAEIPACQKNAPISFEVYQYQNSYVAIIIVDGGKGYIDSLDNPNIEIGFYNDSPSVKVVCKDYGDNSTTVKHVTACIYPTDITSLLTIAGYTSVLENGTTCNKQNISVLKKAVPFLDSIITIEQCKSTNISDVSKCSSLVRNAILGKAPIQGETTKPPPPDISKNCPAPNVFDEKNQKCISVVQPKKPCEDVGVQLLDGSCGKSCGLNQIQKFGKCECMSSFIKDAKATACVADPNLTPLPPASPTSGGGSCSLDSATANGGQVNTTLALLLTPMLAATACRFSKS